MRVMKEKVRGEEEEEEEEGDKGKGVERWGGRNVSSRTMTAYTPRLVCDLFL